VQMPVHALVHDVNGASPVHQDFCEPKITNLWLDDQGDSPWVFDPISWVFFLLGLFLLGFLAFCSGFFWFILGLVCPCFFVFVFLLSIPIHFLFFYFKFMI
jgi:hypothetical protein